MVHPNHECLEPCLEVYISSLSVLAWITCAIIVLLLSPARSDLP